MFVLCLSYSSEKLGGLNSKDHAVDSKLVMCDEVWDDGGCDVTISIVSSHSSTSHEVCLN